MKILMLDSNERSALAATRSLGKAGYEVVNAEVCAQSHAGCSKYSTKSVAYADPSTDAVGFITDLVRIVNENNINIVLPMTDITTFEVAKSRGEFPAEVIVAAADFEKFEFIHNKKNVFNIAQKAGVATPASKKIEFSEDIARFIKEGLTFPVVIKPASSRVNVDGKWKKIGVAYAFGKEELNDYFAEVSELISHAGFEVQERIEGPGIGYFALVRDGEVLLEFAHERLHEKPPSGGVSVLRKSIQVDTTLKEKSQALLKELNWTGVAMVEYKRANDGTYYLMEINGRFWGSLQLAIDAGIDFPKHYIDMVLGKQIPVIDSYKIGIKSRWLLGDLDWLLLMLLKSKKALRLPSLCIVRRISALVEYVLRFFDVTCKLEVLRCSDIRPFVQELKQYVKTICNHR